MNDEEPGEDLLLLLRLRMDEELRRAGFTPPQIATIHECEERSRLLALADWAMHF